MVNKKEMVVVTLVHVNHNDEIPSFNKFKEIMEMAQSGGVDDDLIETSVNTTFEFNGDFEYLVTELVNKGWIDDSDGYEITDEGLEVFRNNPGVVSRSEFKALKDSKTLYNR